jgi:hypothetical protein
MRWAVRVLCYACPSASSATTAQPPHAQNGQWPDVLNPFDIIFTQALDLARACTAGPRGLLFRPGTAVDAEVLTPKKLALVSWGMP